MSKESKKLEKNQKKYKKWSKYKSPKKDCKLCKGKGYYLEECCGDNYNIWYDRHRCGCSQRPRKRYLKFLTDVIISKKKNKKKMKKFFDNNSDCYTHIVDSSRSW